jgi:gephyrin
MVLKAKQVAYISTGGPVPEGSDAVVQVEDTRMTDEVVDGQHSVVEICKQVTKGEDIRAIGSDMMPGELVMKKGEYIGAGEIAMLATVGVTQIPVYRKPTVAIISTGDEVEEPTIDVLPKGKVRDANRAMLVSAVLEAGARPLDMGIARDSEDTVEGAINEAISMGADIIITTGGVSMGSKDFIKPILSRKGTIHFGKICMKPGKPCTFATISRDENDIIVFGLPGNPVSALTTFNLLVSPCIRRLCGFPDDRLEIRTQAVTSFPIRMDSSRTEYRRVKVTFEPDSCDTSTGKLVAYDIAGSQISSRIMSYREANALMVVPSRDQLDIQDGILPSGSLLPVIMLQTKRIL